MESVHQHRRSGTRCAFNVLVWLALLFGGFPAAARHGFSPSQQRPALGDQDQDGYRSVYLPRGTDCDDTNPSIHPGAIEICDGIDQDCDGRVDEESGMVLFADEDGDGWGANGPGVTLCVPTAGYTTISGDCRDDDPNVHPGSIELMDLVDQNCNGYPDETIELPGVQFTQTESDTPRILGDINGDGYDDFIVGTTVANLYLGGPWMNTGLDSGPVVARFDTTICNGQTGLFLRLGDINRDGFDDFGYHCRCDADPAMNFLYIYAGRTRFVDFNLSEISSSLISPDTVRVLTSVAEFAGDIDQDGHADLLLGLSNDSEEEDEGGRVVAMLGQDTWWPMNTPVTRGEITILGEAHQHLGVAVENVGDLNGDGLPEVAVTDQPSSGRQRIHIFSGMAEHEGTMEADESKAVIYSANYEQGIQCTYVGDLSGDGIDDLAMTDGYSVYIAFNEDGAWYLNDVTVTIESLADTRLDLAQWNPDVHHDIRMMAAGDANGDGLPDLLVGDWQASLNEPFAEGHLSLILGVPHVISGSSWPTPSGIYNGCSTAYCLVGSPGTFHARGDLNGDGFSDFLVGGQENGTTVILGF